MLAIREFDGNMKLRGVYVLEHGNDQPPVLAFVDEFMAIEQEQLIEDTTTTADYTWADVLDALVEKANWLLKRREGPFETPLTAEELLKVSQDAIARGVDPHELPKA